MRKLLHTISLFALLFITYASISAQPPALQNFSSPDGRFSILFAGTPKQESETLYLGGKNKDTATSVDISILNEFSVETDGGNVAYMVMYNDYLGNYADGDPQSILASTRDGAVKGKTLLTDNVVSLNGVPGRAFTAKDENWNYTVRQYLKGKRLYQLIVVYNAAHPATVSDQFINSFQIW